MITKAQSILSSFFLLLAFSESQAQDQLITLKGDTLQGQYEIIVRSNNESVNFVNTSGKKQRFRLFDVKRILTADGEIIEPIQIENRYTFGKLIKGGYLSLYAFKGANSKTTFNEMVLTKLDGSSQVVPGAIGFRKAISQFLDECSSVSEKIKNKDLTKNELETIISEFNACLSNNVSASSAQPKSHESFETTLQTQIDDFRTLLKYSDKIENKADVSEMFEDVIDKLSIGKPIPNYLRKLITSSVEKDEQLKKLITSIIK